MRKCILWALGVAAFVALDCTSNSSSSNKGGDKGGAGGKQEGSGGRGGQTDKGTGGQMGVAGQGGTVGQGEGGTRNAAGGGGRGGQTESGGAGRGEGGSAANPGKGGSSGQQGKGGGGSTNSGGGKDLDGGADGDNPANDVVPTCDADGKCTFAWGTYKFAVDTKVGSRIVEFSLDGTNVLVDKEAVKGKGDIDDAYGSTFWTSPQSDFSWPPPEELNSSPHTHEIKPCGSVTCLYVVSPSATIKEKTVTIEKSFSVDAAKGTVTIVYSIVNPAGAAAAVSFAPWEVSRGRSGGLTFFPNPSGDKEIVQKAGSGMGELPIQHANDYTWFPYPSSVTSNAKMSGDGGPKGYIAHVDKSLLFVKAWTDVPREQQAHSVDEFEGEIEIFASSSGVYIEIENQGPYASIPAGSRKDWTVRWSLQKLSSPVTDPAALVKDSAKAKELAQRADSMAAP